MKKTLILIAMMATAVSLWANGDPVAVRSALTLSRNPVAVHVPEVQLLDEHLTVVPTGRYTQVRVEYLLHNRSSRDLKALPYGFPVDYYAHPTDRWVSTNGISMSTSEAGWRDDLVSEVFFTQNGVQLPFQVSADSVLRQGRPLVTEAEVKGDSAAYWNLFENRLDSIGYALYEYECSLMRRWYYVRLDLPAGMAVRLVVSYRVENTTYDALGIINAILPGGYAYRFEYDFAPAAYWGDGHAETFCTDVDARQVYLYCSGSGCADSVPHGLDMTERQRGLWHYEARAFDLAKAEPLTLNFLADHAPLPAELLFNHRIGPDRYTVSVSGAAPKYPAANLSDMDLATATVLRPDGKDSLYITIRFHRPTRLTDIVFVNGYAKSATLWRSNSRVASMKVWRQRDGDDERPDWLFCEYQSRTTGFFTGWNYLPKALRAEAPESFTWQGVADAAQVISVRDYFDQSLTTELHFIIGATAKGTRYDDLCISEIILLGD